MQFTVTKDIGTDPPSILRHLMTKNFDIDRKYAGSRKKPVTNNQFIQLF